MDVRQLQYFLATVEHRSFGRAATVLNVTQPALSKAVGRLERELGVKLLDRLPRGVSPTVYGEALAAHANLIGEEIGRARAAVTGLRDGHVGRVVVGAGSSMRIELLPEACVRLRARVPGAEIKLVGSLYDDLIPDLRRGDLDLVLSMIPNHETESDLVHEPLYADQNHPCVRPGHPLLRRHTVTAADCAGFDWVLPAASNLARRHLEAFFSVQRLPPPRVAIESNSAVFAAGVVERSDLIALLPTQIIAAGGQSSIVALPAPDITMARTVGITYRRASVLLPVTLLLIEELKRTSADMIADGTVMPLPLAEADA